MFCLCTACRCATCATGEVNDCPKSFFLAVTELTGCLVDDEVSLSLSEQMVGVPSPL